jgi:ElaB/YqjD/DUF883 family membrane-anchored ribosome-binding protein
VGDDIIRQREFDQFVKATERELARLEHERQQHDKWHEDEAVREAAEVVRVAAAVQHRREWTWQRILGIITAVGVLVGLELQYIAHH